ERIHAEIAADHAAVIDELGHDAAHHVHGNREADAFRRIAVAQRRADHGRVDADELAASVHERAAGIAHVDGRVGLDEVFERREAELPATGRAHDAHRYGLAQAE